jgi:hypothetical protein
MVKRIKGYVCATKQPQMLRMLAFTTNAQCLSGSPQNSTHMATKRKLEVVPEQVFPKVDCFFYSEAT